eukprot:6373403-Prymnesium_polylepis.1
MAQRRKLQPTDFGTQARLADASQFTDDPLLCAVGPQRTVRFLRVLYEMIGPQGMRLMLAKWHKIHVGGGADWLGAHF